MPEIEKQSGDKLAFDFNVVPVASDLSSDDTVLLALSREQRVEERCQRLKAAGLTARYLVPNAVALFHAFRIFGPAVSGDVVLLSIGKSASDVAVLRDGELLYARSVGTGGDVLTEALVQQFNVSAGKAEKLKREMGDLRPREQRQGLTPQQEKVSYALESAAGRLFQLVQSTLSFAKSQIQLNEVKPAKVFVCGGSARIPGIADYLTASLNVPVALFDPLAEHGIEVQGEASTPEMTVALGLAVMAAEPEAYSVEVQGAGARRLRELKEKHLFTALAVLFLVGYLAFSWVRTGKEFVKAERDFQQLSLEQKRRASNETRLKDLALERDLLAERLDQLEKRRSAGETLVRTHALLIRHLPPELWIENVELDQKEQDRSDRRIAAATPLLRVKGRGRSVGDRPVDRAYADFVTALRQDPLIQGGEFVDTPPTGRDDFRFTLEFSLLQRPELKRPASEATEGEG